MKILAILLLLLFTAAHQSRAEFRIWEDTAGNIWEGEFITMNAGNIVIRSRADKNLEYSPEKLCETDRDYLEMVVPPQLTTDVSKIADHSGVGSNSEQIHLLVSIKQTDARAYSGELTAVVVAMGEDIRTGSVSKVGGKEYRFILPEKRGDVIEFNSDKNIFLRKKIKSGRLYSGYIVVIWDRFGNPISIKSNRDSFLEKAVQLARPKQIKVQR